MPSVPKTSAAPPRSPPPARTAPRPAPKPAPKAAPKAKTSPRPPAPAAPKSTTAPKKPAPAGGPSPAQLSAFRTTQDHHVSRGPARITDEPKRERALDRIGELERREDALIRRGEQAPREEIERLRAQREAEEKKLYGHLFSREPYRRGADLDADAGRRFVQMGAGDRDQMLARMTEGERRELRGQLDEAKADVQKRLNDLQGRAADADPRVQAARKELERLEGIKDQAYERYSDEHRRIREDVESHLRYRLFGKLYADPYQEASAGAKSQHDEYKRALDRVNAQKTEIAALEKRAPRSPEQQAARDRLDGEMKGLEEARHRLSLGPAARADAERWLGASADLRDERIAGGLDATRADSMARHLEEMKKDPARTPEELRAIDEAQARLRSRQLAPELFDFSRRTDARIDELQKKKNPTGAERRELEDLRIARTGLDRLGPGELMNEWSHWERQHGSDMEQAALQREWEGHVARNPEALKGLNDQLAEAKEAALGKLSPAERKEFEQKFELATRFGKDGEGNLTYSVGYAPKQATADQQLRQALASGLHRSQPAMEIARFFRTDDFSRPHNPAEAAAWWQHFEDRRPGELMTSSGGGGLQPTYDEMLIIPTGSLLRFGGQALSRTAVTQFGKNAAKEITANIAWDAAINTAGNAVSGTFGEKYGAAVPFAAIAATLLTGRVMRMPKVQAATQGLKTRVGEAIRRPFVGRSTRVPQADVPVPKTGAPDVPVNAAPKIPPARPIAEPMIIDDSVRHLGLDPKDHIDLVNKHGLQPKHNVTVDNVNYSFSDPFDLGNGRIGVLAVVDDGAQKTVRAFYRSNSQGNFRLLPAQNKGLGHMGLPGYDKGIGETALGLPARAEQTLAGLVHGGKVRADIPADDAGRLFAGAAPINRTVDDYMRYAGDPDYIGKQVTKRPLLEPRPEVETMRVRGHDMLPPQEVRVPEALAPNFDKPIATYKTNTATAGEVDAMVYQSMDGSIEYTMFRDQQNRVWVANVTAADAPITNLGVRGQAVDPGDLTMPLWEYHQQIPPGFAGAPHPTMGHHYADAWAYVREMPLIRAWYQRAGLPVP